MREKEAAESTLRLVKVVHRMYCALNSYRYIPFIGRLANETCKSYEEALKKDVARINPEPHSLTPDETVCL